MTNPVKILLGNLKTILSFGSSNANKNVVTDENGDLKVEAKNNHSHGDITNDGKLGTTNGKPLITTTGGKIATGAFGTSSGQFAEGNHNHDGTYLKTHQDISGKEDKSNKVTSWSATTSDTNYPSEKLVKTGLDGKASSTHNHDGTYLKSYTPPTGSTSQAGILQLEDSYSSTSTTKAATPNAVKAAYDKGNHSHSSYVNPTIADNLTTNDATKVLSAKQGKVLQDNKLDATTAASTYQPKGTYLTSHQSLSDIGGTVTIEKATSNIDGNLARYTIKQGGTALTNGVIDIPKDFLVKSGAVHTVGGSATGDKTASQLGTGYTTGDKYIDFVINTKGNDGTDEHIYINVKDLVDSTVTISRNLTSGTKIGTITINGVATDLYCETNTNTTYSADESTLTKSSGNVFSIKNGGVTSAKIADGTIVNADISSSAAISTSKISGLSAVATSGKASDLTNDNNTFATGGHNHNGVYQPVGNYLTSHNPIDTALDSTSINAVQNKVVKGALDNKLDKASSDTGFVKSNGTIVGFGTTTGKVAEGDHTHSGVYQPVGNYLTSSDITGKEDTTNKVKSTNSISSNSTDDQYASAKLIYNTLLKSDSTVKNGHSHGNIGNGGTLSGKSQNVVTDSSGNITTEAKLVGSSTATDIKMNGTQSAGESNNYAKADHVHPSDTSKVDKVSGKGLSTNDFTNNYKSSLDSINSSYSNALAQIANLTANKLDKRQTDYKGKNVVVHSTSGEITFEDKNNHTHNEYLTSSSLTGYLTKINADTYYQPIGSYLTSNDITGKLDKSQTSYKGKNVVVHSTSGEITFEDKNNHNHTVSDITDFPPIIEEIPFYWVDDFLTYASNSYNVFYDPNNDVQYLTDFIDSNDNNSGFTSDDIKTNRLYQIPYGSSYTHDIYVAFSYDETNEKYNAYYVTTTERYATLYELSLKADTSHSHSNYISKTSSDTGFLKSNGNIDSNTYLTTSSASSTYLTQSSASSTYIPLSARKATVTSGDTTGVPTGDAVRKAIDAVLDNIITQLRS